MGEGGGMSAADGRIFDAGNASIRAGVEPVHALPDHALSAPVGEAAAAADTDRHGLVSAVVFAELDDFDGVMDHVIRFVFGFAGCCQRRIIAHPSVVRKSFLFRLCILFPSQEKERRDEKRLALGMGCGILNP